LINQFQDFLLLNRRVCGILGIWGISLMDGGVVDDGDGAEYEHAAGAVNPAYSV
jgi:hypothetical protein